MFTMTKGEALEIQQRQIAHYKPLCANIAELVAAQTTADQLQDGVMYPVNVINRHIPRGGAIEALIGLATGPLSACD